MKAFNPTAPPIEPIESGLVSSDLHDSLFQKIAARAEIEPGSQQVVLGGIGSGKTTELLLTQKHLRDRGLQAIYMEASRYTNLAEAGPGALVAMSGLEMVELTMGNEAVRSAAQEMRKYANGRWVSTEPHDGYYDGYDDGDPQVFIKGKLTSPTPLVADEVRRIKDSLEALLETSRAKGDVVAIFDGLDRLPSASRFWEVALADLLLLKELEVPVVTVAPWSMLYDPSSTLADRFDRVHELKAETYETLQPKLEAVLLRRDTAKLLSPEDTRTICHASGGVIRDLMTIARDAGEEAYVTDAEVIGWTEIANAVHNLGHSYLRGLSPSQIKALRYWTEGESFDPGRPEILELLMTRRVLQRSTGRYGVHPALASLLLK